jgi:phosphoribosylamine--glycine ligase
LIIDNQGVALEWAIRCQVAGHAVKHFIPQTEKTKHIGRGFVEIVDDLEKWLLWPELIFLCDNTKYLRHVERARLAGIKCIAPTDDTAAWELDRSRGQEMLRKAGVPVPAYVEFRDYDKAIAYVKKRMARFVSKPNNDDDKSLSYVSKSPEDMVYMLERWKRSAKLKSSFLLQEFIDGVEMAVGGWFGPRGWNAGWCENFEFKKLCVGDLGVTTGEQGTVLRFVSTSKLASKVLQPLTSFLQKSNYVGYVDVNCMIDAAGKPWPLEFTMRPGWPTFQIQQTLLRGDPLQWLYDLATGKDSKPFETGKIAIGAVLSVPDYPYSHVTRKEVVGIPVYGLTPLVRESIHFCEMMMGEAPVARGETIATERMPVTAGDYVLLAATCHESVSEAATIMYQRLRRLLVPNSPQWRTDIGRRLARELPILQANGFASEMRY